VGNKHITGNVSAALRYTCIITASIFITSILGCSSGDRPPLGTVHGKITLDGKPLPRANVGFVPTTGGRESWGVSDTDGNYVIRYLRDIMGAKVGVHTVRISTARDRALTTETVPSRYNVKSILQKEVAAGDNVIDFDLTTK
jgi:hypothetical protein